MYAIVHKRLITGVATIALLILGCDVQQLREPGANQIALCAVGTDCGDGLTCDPDLKTCVSIGTNQLIVDLQLLPPGNSDLSREQVLGLKLSESTAIDVQIPKSVKVTGQVTLSQPSSQQVAIIISSAGDIVGTAYRYETTITTNDAGVASYSITVKGGRTYDLSATPLGVVQPTFRKRLVVDGTVGQVAQPISFPAQYWTLNGKVFGSDGSPLALLRVQAYQSNGVQFSTDAITDSDGAFKLEIWPEAGDYVLRVSATSTSLQIPTLDVQQLSVSSSETLIGSVTLPQLPPRIVGVTYRVNGPSDAGEVPVPGVSVTFQAQILGGDVRRTFTTDSNGEVTLDLLSGTYQVTVAPAIGGKWAIHQQNIAIGRDLPTTIKAMLAQKLSTSGAVQKPNGTPLKEATLVFTLVSSTSSSFPLVEGRSQSVKTDAAGAYSLLLDKGFYTIRVDPPHGSGLVSQLFKSFSVEQPGHQFPDLTLSSPGVFSGVVTDTVGTPLVGVVVELFDHLSDSPHLLTSGVTDDAGAFKILVPYQQ